MRPLETIWSNLYSCFVKPQSQVRVLRPVEAQIFSVLPEQLNAVLPVLPVGDLGQGSAISFWVSSLRPPGLYLI